MQRENTLVLVLATLFTVVVLVLVVGTEALVREEDAIVRMIAICCVFLGAMKGMVYSEWAREEGLPMGRYLIFALCWFGMDPQSFRRRRRGLSGF